MTIGIAALATEKEDWAKHKRWPTHILMISDTMGSFGDSDSHPRLHKMHHYPDIGLYMTAANRIDRASELASMIENCLRHLPIPDRDYTDCLQCVTACVYAYKKSVFELEILPRYGVPPRNFDLATAVKSPAYEGPLLEEWQKFDFQADLLIGVFEKHGLPYLFGVTGDGAVDNLSMPGYAAIGIVDKPMFWLTRRAQALTMGVKRTAYHIYEAKLMGEDSPHVNEHIEFLAASRDKYWYWSTHRVPMGDPNPPVTLEQLKEWFEKFGPRITDELDKRSAKAEDQTH